MSTLEIFRPVSSYFDHARVVLTNTDNLIEGGFWGGWFCLTVVDLKRSITERTSLNGLPEGSIKAEAIWSANQTVIATGFSAVASGSMVLTWLHDLQLLPLGALFPFVSSFGYVGSCFSALLKSWNTVQDVQKGIVAVFKADTLEEKGQAIFFQIQKMLQLAFYVSIAAWGALGAVHSLTGGVPLFRVMDTFFYYAVLLFFVNLAAFFTLPTSLPEKPLISSPS